MSEPLLLLSRGQNKPQLIGTSDASSFDNWKADAGHEATLTEVGPEGGWVGVVNLGHTESKLNGQLRIECAEIIAFDFLFWDNVKQPLCPRGVGVAPGDGVCSGHGRCSRSNSCVCDVDHLGPACGSPKKDLTIDAQGKFNERIENGKYLYFKVRVPRDFPGGVLEIKVAAVVPLAVFVSNKHVPDKADFDFANFEDWLKQKSNTALIVHVPAVTASVAAPRRLAECEREKLPQSAHGSWLGRSVAVAAESL
jgi:hypothetical protein